MATKGCSTSSAASHGEHLHEEETTSSRCVTEALMIGRHNFEVSDFSLLDDIGIGEFVRSSTFTVGGYDWNIDLYPDGNQEEWKGAYVSLFLRFAGGESTEGVRVKFRLSLVDKDGRVSMLPTLGDDCTKTHTFSKEGDDWGCTSFIDKCWLRHFLYLNDDSLTIRCVLTVLTSRTEDVSNDIISVPPANLKQDLERMLKDRKGADVTFEVDGQISRAHRCVLSVRSPVFDAELFGPLNKNSAEPVKIDDMDHTIFEGLLHYIDTDSLPDCCDDSDKNTTMQHLLVAADRYGLERLRAMCEAKLRIGIDAETVATTLALAEQHNCEQLKKACVRFIASRDEHIMKTDGFKHLEQSCPLVTKEISDEIARVERRRAAMQKLWSC